MRIKIARDIERKVKATINRLFLKQDDFTIVSNNCWGTFIYKKFGLNYKSPFINLVIFAPDYIELLENFSKEILLKISFIQHQDSKHKEELISLGIYETNYPIGILDNKYELHFLHYTTASDAKEKWLRRVKRMNFEKLVFKFSDGDKFEGSMATRFDALAFENKVCFSSQKFDDLKSVVYLEKFKNDTRVRDEWKVSQREFNSVNFFNNLRKT